ncbi:sulfurtransferase TusA family protein [Ferroglobus sp.]|uniref:sulfurtransferase TusA family protein n=1 Tax=Ferroglobus sp. TaxID=2614230 RepID=UPI0025C07FD1|nr:sulfurtransferase TusA family protein [Ferroglobus sp.]
MKKVDCIGLFCPMPLYMTRKAVEEAEKGEIIEVLADDPAAKKDIPEWAKRMGHEVLEVEERDGIYRIVIRKG